MYNEHSIYVDSELLSKKIGQNIRSIRLRSDMTQEVLAGLSGISQKHLGMIERGEESSTLKPTNPKIHTLQRIARVLNVPLTQLF